MIIVGIDLL